MSKYKYIMELPDEDCFGCGACQSVCPKDCIDFQLKENGFWYPVINIEKCMHCGMCAKSCPANQEKECYIPKDAYACYAKESDIVENSSSGGIFTLLARSVLDGGGCVYGAEFIDGFKKVQHTRISNMQDFPKIRGSKYIQSDMRKYKEIEMDLQVAKTILFSGTPCQCAAVKKVTGNPENLLLVDFKCHGIPSPLVWKNYLESLEKRKHSKITSAQFRNKDWDWFFSNIKLTFENGRRYWESNESGPFLLYFFSDNALRDTCYHCPYRGIERITDITMSDYWNVTDEIPGFINSRGTSYCSVNTEKGKKHWNQILSQCEYIEADLSYMRDKRDPSKTKEIPSATTICHASDVYEYLKKITRKPLKVRVRLAMRLRTNLRRNIKKVRLILNK